MVSGIQTIARIFEAILRVIVGARAKVVLVGIGNLYYYEDINRKFMWRAF